MKTAYIIAVGAALGALVLMLRSPGDSGRALGSAAVDMADGLISGVVVGVGEAVGVPATSQTECQRAKAEGRTWDASFACPAKDFLTYLFE